MARRNCEALSNKDPIQGRVKGYSRAFAVYSDQANGDRIPCNLIHQKQRKECCEQNDYLSRQRKDVIRMLKEIVLLLIGFALLIKGSDYMIDAASCLAKKPKIPRFINGFSVIAFGTSAP